MSFFTDLLIQMIQLIASDLPTDFFDNSYISTTLDYFQWLGWVIFAIASLFMVFGVMERKSAGEFINGTMIFGNWTRALCLVIFARPLVIYLFTLCQDVADSVVSTIIAQAQATDVILPSDFTNVWTIIWSAITNALQGVIIQGLIFAVMLPATVVMLIQLMRVFAVLYVQIIGGYLSVVDLMLGDGGVFYGWMRDVIATCVTFMLQYTFFIGGVVIIDAASWNGLVACAPGLILAVGASVVPAALKRYGFNIGGPSVGGSLAGASRAALSVGMLAAKV